MNRRQLLFSGLAAVLAPALPLPQPVAALEPAVPDCLLLTHDLGYTPSLLRFTSMVEGGIAVIRMEAMDFISELVVQVDG